MDFVAQRMEKDPTQVLCKPILTCFFSVSGDDPRAKHHTSRYQPENFAAARWQHPFYYINLFQKGQYKIHTTQAKRNVFDLCLK